MKKIIVLLIGIILLSGCTLKYKLNINDYNNIKEETILSIKTDSENTPDMIKKIYYEIKDYYELKNINETFYSQNDNIIIKTERSGNELKSFLNSGNIKLLFENINIYKENDNYHIKLSGYKNVFSEGVEEYNDLEDFEIVINSNLKIKSSNANKKSNITGKYIWTFDTNTKEDKTIEFVLTNKTNYIAKFYNENTVLFYIVVVVLGGILIFAFYKLYKKANS